MNFVVISKDDFYLNEIKNKINENIHYYFISTYSSFKEYKKKKKVFEINCFIIDMDLDNWFENTKTIYKENAHYIFIGSNLKESYKVYSFEKVIYVYKNEFSYFENALKKLKNESIDYKNIFVYNWKNINYVQNFNEILYFESDKRKTNLHLTNGTIVSTYKNINEFMDESKDEFVRIHKKYLINKNDFQRIQREKVKMVDGTVLPVSRPYIPLLKEYGVLKEI